MTYRRKEVIGPHTLYLGDARSVIDGLEFDSIVADPPYGMEFRSNHRAVRSKFHAIANDNSTDALVWTTASIGARHSKYVFCRWDNIPDVPKPKSCITWVKNNWSMGDLTGEHARQSEVALFYPGPAHFFPCGRPSDVISAPRTGNESHPTEKPVQLLWHVVRWTDGVVLDPFMGSGTTLVACQKLGRVGIGIEIDEKYFDVACRRVDEAMRQPDLFVETPKRAEQLSMLP